nr:hypothetical protein [Tanacetum cinerariifolium]
SILTDVQETLKRRWRYLVPAESHIHSCMLIPNYQDIKYQDFRYFDELSKLGRTNVAGLCGGSDGGIVGVVGYGGVGQKSRERRAQGMAGILEVNSVFLNRGGRQGIGPQVLYF